MAEHTGGPGWARRFRTALPAAAAAALTFFFFSPMENVMHNVRSFYFSAVGPALGIMGLTSLGLTAALAAGLALLRGRAYRIGLALAVGLGLGLYLQGTFLAGSTPPLNDNQVDWGAKSGEMILNGVLWAAVLAVPFVALRFRKIRRTVFTALPLLMIAMQLAGFVSVAVKPESAREDGYLSYEDLTDYSREGDVLVFMVDRLDYEYIRAVLDEEPDFFDALDGFTCYENAISQFAHTRNGMNFILTNYDRTLFREPADDFFYHSWDDGDRHLLKDLKAGGYTVDLYGHISSLLGKNYAEFQPWIRNLRLGNDDLDPGRLTGRMAALSAYRTFPLALKPFFCHPVEYYNQVYQSTGAYAVDETVYDGEMPGMTVTDQTRYFKFYEFHGTHDPFHLDRSGKKSAELTDVAAQTRGVFSILMRAFTEMKKAGTYEKTAVIICADHAAMLDDYIPLPGPARIGLFYKPAGRAGEAPAFSDLPVSLRNIPATILKNAGLDYSAYGVPLDEVQDDPGVIRDYCRTISLEGEPYGDREALYYDVGRDASAEESWTLTRRERIEYPLGF